MLGSLKRSPEYDAVRKRVSDPKPIDAWRVGDQNFFVFALESSSNATGATFALFKMRWDHDGPELALTIARGEQAGEVQVSDVRNPGQLRIVSLNP